MSLFPSHPWEKPEQGISNRTEAESPNDDKHNGFKRALCPQNRLNSTKSFSVIRCVTVKPSCVLCLFSSSRSEITWTEQGTMCWAWHGSLKTSWQRSQISLSLTWRVGGSNRTRRRPLTHRRDTHTTTHRSELSNACTHSKSSGIRPSSKKGSVSRGWISCARFLPVTGAKM